MIYKFQIFDCKVHNVMLWYTFNQRGYAVLKHQLNIFTNKHQTCKYALDLFLLVY